jgi:NitT/TauT family transport system ATP-binding protein
MAMKITIDNLGKTYDSTRALESIDLEIAENEFFTIVGPSGCGKSTLLEAIAGLIAPTEGQVKIGADKVDSPHDAVGVVFQEDSTFPWRTVLENVCFGLETDGMGRQERRKRAREMISLVGLDGFEDHYPTQLSGGMRQRVAIARTLVMGPRVLLMDEPFGALDEQTRLLLGDELVRIWERTGATVVFVTHSITEAVLLSDRVGVMTARPGRIKDVIAIGLERPRDSGLIATPTFGELSGAIWELLKSEAGAETREAVAT